jgi:hypothetical protein
LFIHDKCIFIVYPIWFDYYLVNYEIYVYL